MGPRSCERGNSAGNGSSSNRTSSFNGAALVRARKCQIVYHEHVPAPPLQWGRARASAEMTLEASTLCAYDRFNGAALVRARKSPDPPIVTGARLASMGPRSCERGNQARTKEGAKK